jgi:hypothetical protein
MSIALPLQTRKYPYVRILVRQRWSEGGSNQETSGAGWEKLPMAKRGRAKNGYRLLDCERACLPMVGTARFALHYGKIDNTLTQVSAESATRMRAGESWDADLDDLEVRDLTGYEVRIQASDRADVEWRTIFWGVVHCQEDSGWPGASIPAGERLYWCVDGLARVQKWQMTRHGFQAQNWNDSAAATTYGPVKTPLGYNVGSDGNPFGRLAKNRGSVAFTTDGGVSVQCHVAPGATDSDYWSDKQAAEHALAVSKPAREPLFLFSGYTGLLTSCVGSWDVRETDTAWTVLNRICRRERGRGVCFVDWEDDSDDPEGPLTCMLTIQPQLRTDITVNNPAAGTTLTIGGADSLNQTISVDLVGDHRAVAESFKITDLYEERFDHLETCGEFIQVLATLSFIDISTGSLQSTEGVALVKGWSNTDQTTFRDFSGTSLNRRTEQRFRPIYQRYLFRPDWKGHLGGARTGSITRGDFRCDDSGAIVVPGFFDTSDTPGYSVEIMSDLPLFEAYSYLTSTLVRYDADDESVDPTRRPILPMFRRTGQGDKFITFDHAKDSFECSPTLHVDKGGMWVIDCQDDGKETRRISDTTKADLQADFNYSDLVLTVGLRLPHRVRFASGDVNGRRKGRIIHADHHLWLAHHEAIWELDCSTSGGDKTNGFSPRRQAAGAAPNAPGLLRDDRDALAFLHGLSWQWYGPTTTRRAGTWAVRDCGMLPSFSAVVGAAITSGEDAEDVTYPTLGKVVTDIVANGQTTQLNTPVTRIRYDHEQGVTTWSTEWNELAFE